jgi:hypothetical protein
VAVVVDPLRPHHGVEARQPQRRRGLPPRLGPRGFGARILVEPLLELAQRRARADVELAQHLLDGDQIVVAQALELADRAARRLLLGALDHAIDQGLGQFRRLEFGPRPFQAGPNCASMCRMPVSPPAR